MRSEIDVHTCVFTRKEKRVFSCIKQHFQFSNDSRLDLVKLSDFALLAGLLIGSLFLRVKHVEVKGH